MRAHLHITIEIQTIQQIPAAENLVGLDQFLRLSQKHQFPAGLWSVLLCQGRFPTLGPQLAHQLAQSYVVHSVPVPESAAPISVS